MLSEMILMREQDIAKIANRLQVPLIIADILNGTGALTNDVHMGLHEVLSDDQPDSALLSIALSARALAVRFDGCAAIFDMLKTDCDRIIAEYGMMWLRNAQSKSLDDNTVFETLVHIPEDLECLAELLEFAKMTLEDADNNAADLCNILITQANSQSLIAQTFLEGMDMGTDAPWESSYENTKLYEDIVIEQAMKTYTDNVIQFPKTIN